MLIFIITAGLVIKCTLDIDVVKSFCVSGGFKEFGILASAGLLEMIYEFRGIVSIFQKKNDNEHKDKKEED